MAKALDQQPSDNLIHPRHWPSWIAIAVLRIIAALPFRAKLFAGKFFGLLAYRLAKKRRHITETNIRICFPELDNDQQIQLVRDVFIQNGIGFFEIAWSWWAQPQEIEGRYTIENLDLLHEAQADGSGVLLVGAHFVHLDLCGAMLIQHAKINPIYRRNNDPVFEKIITKGRKRNFPLVMERSNMKAITRELRAGTALWYAPDQDFNHRQSVFAPFFGQQASTLTATARLSKLGKAKVLGLFHYRDPNTHHYRIVFKPIDSTFPTGDDVQDATLVNQMIEAAIREEPAQYMWVHRRFKTRPPGEPAVY